MNTRPALHPPNPLRKTAFGWRVSHPDLKVPSPVRLAITAHSSTFRGKKRISWGRSRRAWPSGGQAATCMPHPAEMRTPSYTWEPLFSFRPPTSSTAILKSMPKMLRGTSGQPCPARRAS
jgi:hypothetical protein